jgi:hypothetical protein
VVRSARSRSVTSCASRCCCEFETSCRGGQLALELLVVRLKRLDVGLEGVHELRIRNAFRICGRQYGRRSDTVRLFRDLDAGLSVVSACTWPVPANTACQLTPSFSAASL